MTAAIGLLLASLTCGQAQSLPPSGIQPPSSPAINADDDASGLPAKATAVPEAGPLNVVLITLDDLNYDSCGYTGCPIPGITPSIDSLAASGMRFDHAYVVTSLCGPSRAVMLTGRYPRSNGIMGNRQQPPDGWQPPKEPTPSLMRLLRDHGYLTAGILKWKQSVKATEFDITWDNGPYGLHDGDRDPEAFYQRTMECIARARRESTPFFLYVNPIDPHDPWPDTAEEAEMLKKYNPTNSLPAPTRRFTPEEVFVPPFLPDIPGIRASLAPYYASVHRGDQCVGRILDALRDSGQLDRTLLIFCSDNGMGFPGSKLSLFYASVRTPLIVSWPGRVKAGTRDAVHMVSTVDFVPTILEAVGLPVPSGMDGRSLIPLLEGRAPSEWPQTAYLDQNYFNGSTPDEYFPVRGVVGPDYIYIWNAYVDMSKEPRPYFDSERAFVKMMRDSKDARAIQRARDHTYRPVEQLFRIDVDPGCWENLANQPASQPVLQRMRAELREKLSSTDDPLIQLFGSSLKGP